MAVIMASDDPYGLLGGIKLQDIQFPPAHKTIYQDVQVEYAQTAYARCGLRGLSGYVHHAAAFQKRFIDSAPEAVEGTLIVVGRSHTRRQRHAVFRSTIKTTISVVPRWRSGWSARHMIGRFRVRIPVPTLGFSHRFSIRLLPFFFRLLKKCDSADVVSCSASAWYPRQTM